MASSQPVLDLPCEPAGFSIEAQGHAFTFFPGGHERLAALLGLIDSARERLILAFYIFATDRCSALVRDALTRAAARGVEVRVIVDGFGADADEAFFAPMIDAGGHYCTFQAKWSRRYLIRNHQKLVVADRRVAMLGGFNVEDGYFVGRDEGGWTDLAFTVEGPVVERIETWFDQLEHWCLYREDQFIAIRRMVRRWDAGSGPVQLLIGGPTLGLSSWARGVSHDLLEGDRLDIMMAYFSPPRSLARRICRIARKGRTRLILSARSDNPATVGATRAYITKLLRAEVEVHEYSARKLHTKLIVLDDAVYLGSANFDVRSLYLNLEIVLRIEDAALAARMRELLDEYLPDTVRVTRADHAARANIWNRIRWRLSWFLVSVVDYTVSRKLNLGL